MSAVIAGACESVVVAECRYEVTTIHGPDCGLFGPAPTRATAINDRGEVAGFFTFCTIGQHVPFIWRAHGDPQMEILVPPAGNGQAEPWDINNDGWLAGTINGDVSPQRGFLYRDGEWIILPTLPGADFSAASAMSEEAVIVGNSGNTIVGPGSVAFIWQRGSMSMLLGLSGSNSDARDINEFGQVTGWVGASLTTDARAFLWREGLAFVLPPIPGGYTSEGRALNNLGHAVGRGRLRAHVQFGFVRHAYLWDGHMAFDLGTLPGFEDSLATSINDCGQIVGFCQTTTQRAFLWEDGVMNDLNHLLCNAGPLVVKVVYMIANDGTI
ncbi:MAG: hypothetical protein L0271_27525, partial [Gemmatimonadetes bacterium]|nr:hypothetical protein [Gemmatimonadota bacterium]